MKTHKILHAFGIITIGIFILYSTLSCSKKTADTVPIVEKSSWELLNEKIIQTNCAISGCHATGTDASFKQHQLVLETSVAYQNMLNIACTNTNAAADGLLRIKPFKSEESLLYHKLRFDADTHHTGKQYGSPMPLGLNALSVGQIEFVRRWIEAGAPKTGNVVDVTLLDDKTPSVSTTFTPLDAPKTGEGFQMIIPKFEVAPNFERELFLHKKIGNTSEIYVNRITIKSRPNTHHFLMYDFRNPATKPALDIVRDLRNPDGTLNISTVLSMSNHIFLAGGSNANSEYFFPVGTALKLPAEASIDLNSHYFNKSNSIIYGECYANLYTIPKANVANIVQMLDLNNTSLSLPPNSRKTITKTFTFDKNVRIVMLTSHSHKLGEKFVIKIAGGTRNGEVVYQTTDWEHPDIINFGTPIDLQKGEGLTSEVTYNNTTAKTVAFGLTSEDEMDIIFGYYYDL